MFHDRVDAAGRLARELERYRGRKDTVVLAVPRGGLPIGGVLARELDLKLDVILTKKIGHPDNPEFAIGAVSITDEAIDSALVERECIPSDYITAEIERVRENLRQRYRLYCGAARPLPVAGAKASGRSSSRSRSRRRTRSRSSSAVPTRWSASRLPLTSWRSGNSTITSPRSQMRTPWRS